MSKDDFTEERMIWLQSIAEDPKLPTTSYRLAMIIACKYLSRKKGRKAWPGVKTLAADMKITPRGVQKARDCLVKHGHLAVAIGASEFRTNFYRMAPKSAVSAANATERSRQMAPDPEQTLTHPLNKRSPSTLNKRSPKPFDLEPSESEPIELRQRQFIKRGLMHTDKSKSVSLKNPEAFLERLYQIDPDGALGNTIVNYVTDERFQHLALRCYNSYRFDEESFIDRLSNLQLEDNPSEDTWTVTNFLNGEFILLLPKKKKAIR